MDIDDLDGRRDPPTNLIRDDAVAARGGRHTGQRGRNGSAADGRGITRGVPAHERGPPQGGARASGRAPLPHRTREGGADEAPAGDDSHLSKRQKRRRRSGGSPAQVGVAVVAAVVADAAFHPGPTPAARKNRRRRRRGNHGASAPGGSAPAMPESEGEVRIRQGLAGLNGIRAVVPARPAAAMVVPVRAPVPRVSASAGEGASGEERARPPVYAALDLGTNNCRLLVAVPTRPGQFRVVDAFSRIVRLGEGLGRTGRLALPAMDRAVAALAICSQKLAAREVAGARLIATEACRAAANGEEFIERVERETGLRLEIVSRETEARLAVSGCGSLVDRNAEGAVLFDIGGGSTEIALLDLARRETRRLSNAIVAWTSLPVGVVTLAERYGGRDVPPTLFEAMVSEVEERIAAFPGRHALADIAGTSAFHLLGTSGTVTTLAGIHLGLERYDRRQVDGLWLNDAEVGALIARIAGWSFEERVANPCIGSDRADLVLAGCAILEAIRRVWPAPALRVADRGLREGLLTEMMVADGVWRKGAGQARPQRVPA